MTLTDRNLRVLAWPARKNQDENPYNKELYDSLCATDVEAVEFDGKSAFRADVDLIHIHWPDGILKGNNKAIALLKLVALIIVISYWRALRRKPIIWTVHNYGPHGAKHPALARILYLFLSKTVSLLIHMNDEGKREVDRRLPQLRNLPHVVIPIGLYAPMMGYREEQTIVRQESSLSNAVIFGYIGRIEPYKGALKLSKAFSQIPSTFECELKIVGGCTDSAYREQIHSSVAGDARQMFLEGWLTNHDMIRWIQQCDVVVLPYESVLNSSSIMLPIELGVPVLAPDMGSLHGVADKIGNNWLILYTGELTADTLTWCSTLKQDSAPDLSQFRWDSIATKTRASYESVLK